MATKTYQNYYDEQYKIGEKQLAQQKKTVKAASDDMVAQIGAAIDTAAGAQQKQYQRNIDTAGDRFQQQFDANTVQQLVERKKLEESMANMGLTDSGLNRSQQTALSIQKNNADAAARRDMHDYTTRMQDAIDNVMANASAQKQTTAAQAAQSYSDWVTAAQAAMQQNAASNAASLYTADTQAETAAKQLAYEAQKDAAARELQWKTAVLKATASGSNTEQQRSNYAQNLIKQGYSEAEAWTLATARYPGSVTADNAYAQAYANAQRAGVSADYAQVAGAAAAAGKDPIQAMEDHTIDKAREVVGTKNYLTFNKTYGVVGLIYNYNNMKYVAKNVKTAIENLAGYEALDSAEKDAALGVALANTLRSKYKSSDDLKKCINGTSDSKGLKDHVSADVIKTVKTELGMK